MYSQVVLGKLTNDQSMVNIGNKLSSSELLSVTMTEYQKYTISISLMDGSCTLNLF